MVWGWGRSPETLTQLQGLSGAGSGGTFMFGEMHNRSFKNIAHVLAILLLIILKTINKKL